MKVLAPIFLRAMLMVTAVSLNVTVIATGSLWQAALTGGLVSWIWWGNTRTAALTSHPWAKLVYTSGAACGTVTGVLLGRLF